MLTVDGGAAGRWGRRDGRQTRRDADVDQPRLGERLRLQAAVVVAEDPVGGPPEAGLPVRPPLHHPDTVAPSPSGHDGAPAGARHRVPPRRYGGRERGPVPARTRVPGREEARSPLVDGAVERSDVDRARRTATRHDDRAARSGDRADPFAGGPELGTREEPLEVGEGQRRAPVRRWRSPVVVFDDGAQVRQGGAAEHLVVAVRVPVRGGEVDGLDRTAAVLKDLPGRRVHRRVPPPDARCRCHGDPPEHLTRRGRADRRVQRCALRTVPSGGREGVTPRGDRLRLQRRGRPRGRDLRDPLEVALERQRDRQVERAVARASHRERPRVAGLQSRLLRMPALGRSMRIRAVDPERAVLARADHDEVG